MKILGSKMGSRLSRTPGSHGGYQCVAQLSLSRAMAFFCLSGAAFSRGAVPYVSNTRKLAQNYPGQS